MFSTMLAPLPDYVIIALRITIELYGVFLNATNHRHRQSARCPKEVSVLLPYHVVFWETMIPSLQEEALPTVGGSRGCERRLVDA